MSREEEGRRTELIETLPDGTQRWRVVKAPEPPKKRLRMVKDYKQIFMELYDQGLNDTVISEILGFTPSTISGYRRRIGLPVNLMRVGEYKADFMELYGKGLSDGKIGKKLGFNRQTIGNFRRSLGLPANFKFWGKPGLDEEEKQRIRDLHGKGLPISMIAEEIGRSGITVYKFCKKEKLDTSLARGKRYIGQRHGENLVSYLEEHGPTPQSTLSADLKISKGRFSRIARELFDQVELFPFKLGSQRGRGEVKYGSHSIYGDLSFPGMGNVFALRDDPRIIDFVAERIGFKVETPQDARTLVQHLGKQLGTPRARDVMRKLGYVYTEDRVGTHPKTKKKFTDQQLLDLYDQRLIDREIAEKLGVTTASISVRRRKLGLPALGRMKRKITYPLDGLDQIEPLSQKTFIDVRIKEEEAEK